MCGLFGGGAFGTGSKPLSFAQSAQPSFAAGSSRRGGGSAASGAASGGGVGFATSIRREEPEGTSDELFLKSENAHPL